MNERARTLMFEYREQGPRDRDGTPEITLGCRKRVRRCCCLEEEQPEEDEGFRPSSGRMID